MLTEIKDKFSEKKGFQKIPKSLIFTIIGIFLFFIFLYTPVNVMSAAMEPTLLEGDYILVSKYSYGYGKYSFPFNFPKKGRIFGRLPKRGDIIAFKTPRGDFGIQRIVGLPGDRIQMKSSMLYINNKQVSRKFLEVHDHVCKFHERLDVHDEESARQYLETLPEGKAYKVLDIVTDDIVDNTGVYIVPKGYYFVIGDNRDESLDSRFKDISFIPYEHIIGKSHIILFSLDEHTWKFWKWPSNVRWTRFFNWTR